MYLFCPILKTDCIECGCAFWNETFERCAICLCGEGLKDFGDAIKSDDGEVFQIQVKVVRDED